MFSRMQFLAAPEDAANRFGVKSPDANLIPPSNVVNAFDHPFHPVITNKTPGVLSGDFRWGLVPPDWPKAPEDIWNHTISAKLEYIAKRYSWRNVSANRCLVPVTGYYEYHWNDPAGRSKTRYLIRSEQSAIFALAGLFSEWTRDGISYRTFAVCTTNANKIMEFVHNKDAARNYSRMPVMLRAGDELHWLDAKVDYREFAYPDYRPLLIAQPDTPQTSLF